MMQKNHCFYTDLKINHLSFLSFQLSSLSNCLGNNLNSWWPLLSKQHILGCLEESNYSNLEPRQCGQHKELYQFYLTHSVCCEKFWLAESPNIFKLVVNSQWTHRNDHEKAATGNGRENSIFSISLISNITVSKVEFLKLISSLFTNFHKRRRKKTEPVTLL